jgi:hypothetical protein
MMHIFGNIAAHLLELIEFQVAELVNDCVVQITEGPLEERPLAGPLLDDGHVQPQDRGPLVTVVAHAFLDERVDFDQLFLRLDVADGQVLKFLIQILLEFWSLKRVSIY